jgi:DNA primase catalytic core
MNEIREKILNLDIVEIISRYTQLKKSGSNYRGLCKFHNEKTPSLMVSAEKGIWKCFGCGKGGNLIDFVMETEGESYQEAVARIARDHHIDLPRREQTNEEREKDLHREALFTANKIAARYFEDCLYQAAHKPTLDYALSRWKEETVRMWGIGFAPDSWDGLLSWSREQGVKTGILMELGLIREGKGGKLYDFFRGRIIFPIHDHMGRVAGFTGRVIHRTKPTADDKQPKYINTPETPVYSKEKILYGLNLARRTAREKHEVWLVEGNPDVIRLHEIEIHNTVAPCGTSLTEGQVKLLKELGIKTVNIIGDSDPAGQNAVRRSAEMLIKDGITVKVLDLPMEKGNKEDPDSFFKTLEQFNKTVASKQDYIIKLAKDRMATGLDPDTTTKTIEELTTLIAGFVDKSRHKVYIDQLSRLIPPKDAWADKLKSVLKDNPERDRTDIIPKHVDVNDFERYGFYSDSDGYHFRTKSGIVRGCNFTMKPLFHIQSVLNAKRLYEIKNEFGHTEVIELLQKDLVALAAFKVRVESLGNFLWEATETELNKLKRYLYEKTETCIEISQLGWQKAGFYAWANGIYNGGFLKVDANGIVRHNDKNYYLPAFSSIYKGEEGLFLSERRYLHSDNNKITFLEYSRQLRNVFGDNAIVAICFYIASLFRDHLVRLHTFFPILNLFGPKGTGKTELAVSLLHFFGKGGKGPNINNTTKAALADHVAMLSNGCVHIDEYKNNIDFEKIEFLKGLWDGTGRTRMNMDKDKKKETTAVDCGVILSGQEMPTADIALFSRLIYLSFFKTEYSDDEKRAFNELKEVEKKGLTHITHEILAHRAYFLDNYVTAYDRTADEISAALGKEVIEDRLFRNWVSVLASYFTLEEKIRVSFTHAELISIAARQLLTQQKETRTSNEISTFWNLVQYMYADGMIQDGVDFRVEFGVDRIKTDLGDFTFPKPKNVIYIQHSRIIPLYRKIGKMNQEKVLPGDSIDYYLKHDKRFIGKKLGVAFKAVDPKSGLELQDAFGKAKRKITRAYAFDYDLLEISLHNESDQEDTDLPLTSNNFRKERDLDRRMF